MISDQNKNIISYWPSRDYNINDVCDYMFLVLIISQVTSLMMILNFTSNRSDFHLCRT